MLKKCEKHVAANVVNDSACSHFLRMPEFLLSARPKDMVPVAGANPWL